MYVYYQELLRAVRHSLPFPDILPPHHIIVCKYYTTLRSYISVSFQQITFKLDMWFYGTVLIEPQIEAE